MTVPDQRPVPGTVRVGDVTDARLAAIVTSLGRNVVLGPGEAVPVPWHGAREAVVDAGTVDDDVRLAALVDDLHASWACREPRVVRLAVPPADLRAPQATTQAPWQLGAAFTFARERLAWLCWVNSYDGRGWLDSGLRWWWTVRAERAGLAPCPDLRAGDVFDCDGTAAHLDGGPRGPVTGWDRPLVAVETLSGPNRRADRVAWPAAELAADQYAAVTHPSGAVRVLAPAGSGKTRVLTERVHHLTTGRGWEPEGIVALAYNTRAAEELRDRVGPAARRMQIRTIHSFAYAILTSAARAAGRAAPEVATEAQRRAILRDLWQPRSDAVDDPYGAMLDGFSRVRSGLLAPSAAASADPAAAELLAPLPKLFGTYRSALAARNLCDFDDQVYAAIEALCTDPDLRRRVQARCRHVLVDEFQDITPAQLLLVRLAASPALDVFAVGDDDQTIYSHNGARPEFLVDFGDLFPAAATRMLEVNYRCPQAVVAAADQLLRRNAVRVPKTIRAADDGSRPPRVGDDTMRVAVLERSAGHREAAGAVVDALAAGTAAEEVAVLARTNAALLPTQLLLTAAGVPVTSTVTDTLVSSSTFGAAFAYLRIARGSRVSGRDLAAVANRPMRYLSRAFISRLRGRSWTLEELRSLTSSGELRGRSSEHWAGLVALCTLLARQARAGASDSELLEHVTDAFRSARAPSAQIDDVAALAEVARVVDGDLEAAVAASVANGSSPGGVTLSAVHRVKGREWDVVVVVGADAGAFPHHAGSGAAHLEEERRVFHVAVTRARRQLLVVADATRPSPFVLELTGQVSAASSRSVPEQAPSRDRGAPTIDAHVGMDVTLDGGFRGRVDRFDGDDVLVRLGNGTTMRVRSGDVVRVDGARVKLTPPAGDTVADPAAFAAGVRAAAEALDVPGRILERLDGDVGDAATLIARVGGGYATRILTALADGTTRASR